MGLSPLWHRLTEWPVFPARKCLDRRHPIRFDEPSAEWIGWLVPANGVFCHELSYFLGRWVLRQYADYNVGFFAMHGEPSCLWMTDRHSLTLPELGQHLEDKCAGKRLYFGSCSVLSAPKADLVRFLRTTGAAMMCGYVRRVNWVASAAFETVLLDVLANGRKSNSVEQRMGAISWAPLASFLGFRIVYADGRVWRPDPGRSIPRQPKADDVDLADAALVLGEEIA